MNKLDIIGICLAIGYLFACYIFTGFQVYGSWNIMLLALFAFPFSFLSLLVAYYTGGGPILFIAMNTIWWWFMGFCLGRCVSRNKQFLSIVLTAYITIMYLSMFFMWL